MIVAMKITNIPQATEITIQMVYNGAVFSTKATVLTPYCDGILVTPITFAGKMVESCCGGTLEYTKPSTGVTRRFQIESMSKADFSGSQFHVIRGREIVEEDNKRKAERYMVQRLGTAIINGRIRTNVIVNDISMRGISLLLGKGQHYKKGDVIDLSFLTDDNANSRRLRFKCQVVRQFVVQGFEAVGCTVKNIDMDYLNFVNEKKEEHRKKVSVRLAV